MVELLFYFWFVTLADIDGAESPPHATYAECEETRLLYASEGEVTSQCYAR